jgi:hypothetical protein
MRPAWFSFTFYKTAHKSWAVFDVLFEYSTEFYGFLLSGVSVAVTAQISVSAILLLHSSVVTFLPNLLKIGELV